MFCAVKHLAWKIRAFVRSKGKTLESDFFFFLARVPLVFASDIKYATVESVLGQRSSHEWSVSLVKTGDE